VAGTRLLTPSGDKLIEEIQEGEEVLSRNDSTPEGPIEARVVEKTFVRVAPILIVKIRGQEIRTTREHPFYVRNRGWITAGELVCGDDLSSHDGQWVTVESVMDPKEVATVYNLRVSEYHTYFVGSREWGFSVWAHNANYALIPHGSGYRLAQIGEHGAVTVVNEAGTTTPRFFATRQLAEEAVQSGGGSLVARAAPDLTSVPSLEGGAFQRWFNSLTGDELTSVWQRGNPIRRTVETRLRNGGYMHEWLPVSRAPQFREWGITAEQVHEWTTATDNLLFRSPPAPAPRPGQGLGHGAAGSTTFHNRIFDIIESSADFPAFRTALQTLADEWVVGGAQALPVGLRP
jgi:hypothetical protein